MKNEKTQIEVSKATRARLRGLRITKRESYDEVINRLIDSHGMVPKVQ